jgi:hypothetical protein
MHVRWESCKKLLGRSPRIVNHNAYQIVGIRGGTAKRAVRFTYRDTAWVCDHLSIEPGCLCQYVPVPFGSCLIKFWSSASSTAAAASVKLNHDRFRSVHSGHVASSSVTSRRKTVT